MTIAMAGVSSKANKRKRGFQATADNKSLGGQVWSANVWSCWWWWWCWFEVSLQSIMTTA